MIEVFNNPDMCYFIDDVGSDIFKFHKGTNISLDEFYIEKLGFGTLRYNLECDFEKYDYYNVSTYGKYVFKVDKIYSKDNYFSAMCKIVSPFTPSFMLDSFCDFLKNEKYPISKVIDICEGTYSFNFCKIIIEKFDIDLMENINFTKKVIDIIAYTSYSHHNSLEDLEYIISNISDVQLKKECIIQYIEKRSYNRDKLRISYTSDSFNQLYLHTFFNRLKPYEIIDILAEFDKNDSIVYNVALDEFMNKSPTRDEIYKWCNVLVARPSVFNLTFWDKFYLFFVK